MPALSPARLLRIAARYRDMAGDVGWSLLSDLLGMVVNIVSFIILGSQLQAAGYGGYVGLFGITSPLGALSWSGLTLLVLQRTIREKESPQAVLRSALTLTLAQGLVVTVVGAWLASRIISTLDTTTTTLVVVAELVWVPIIMVMAALVQAVAGFPAATRIRITVQLLRFAALLTLAIGGSLTVRNLAVGWNLAFAAMAVVMLVGVLPRLGLTLGLGRPSRGQLITNVQLSLPLAGANLQTNGDKAVMNAYGLESGAGLYGAAFRVIMLAQMPVRTMNTALFQRFLSDDDGRRNQHLRRATRFVGVSAAVSIAISLVVFAATYLIEPVIVWLVGEQFAGAVPIIRWLLVVVPLAAVSRAPLNGLLGLGRNNERAWIVLSSGALSVALYILLIPIWSWRGGVMGTIVGELYITVVGWTALIVFQRKADRRADAQAEATESAPAVG